MENPLKYLMEEKNLNYAELTIMADMCESAVYKNMNGTRTTLSTNILDLFDKLGYDPEKINKQYKEFREEKQQELIKEAK